jgi:helix-turn-helix protein
MANSAAIDRAHLAAVPLLDELATRPDRAIGLPVETIAGLLAKNAAAGNALSAALLLSKSNPEPNTSIDEDETWLTPDEAAPILRRKKRWIYRNAGRLPFVRKVSGRGLLCSEKGLRRWLERQKV